MEKKVRISTMEEHELHRIQDIAKMPQNKRVEMVLEMQYRYYSSHNLFNIERVAAIRSL